MLNFINMLNVYISFLLYLSIFIANGKLSKDIAKDIKFQCGEVFTVAGVDGHVDDDGDGEVFNTKSRKPSRNFTLIKDITTEDHLMIECGFSCGRGKQPFSVPMDFCGVLESNDNLTSLAKSYINLFGFNVTTCPIPAGSYIPDQNNIIDPLIVDSFISLCDDEDQVNDGSTGYLYAYVMAEFPIMYFTFGQVQEDGQNCEDRPSLMEDAFGIK